MISLVHTSSFSLEWRHNGLDSVSNHQPRDCLLNRLFRRRSKKTSKLRVTDLCEGNSPGTGEFPAQMTSSAENVSIWWRHHVSSRISIMEKKGWVKLWILHYWYRIAPCGGLKPHEKSYPHRSPARWIWAFINIIFIWTIFTSLSIRYK